MMGWTAFALVLQWLQINTLAWVAIVVLPASLFYSRQQYLLLLRRTLWLLITLALVFALATPGENLPGLASATGIAREGALLAATHILRLVLLLGLLALLLEWLNAAALVSGLYLLLAPLVFLGVDRCRVAVRLLLVLEYVEFGERSGENIDWREWLNRTDPPASLADNEKIALTVAPFSPADYAIMAVLAAAVYCGAVLA